MIRNMEDKWLETPFRVMKSYYAKFNSTRLYKFVVKFVSVDHGIWPIPGRPLRTLAESCDQGPIYFK